MKDIYANSVVHVESHRGGKPYNKQIFGQFIEHFHRQIYGGIFEPGSPLSDDSGFRLDVIEAVRELKVPIVRWPGGCFVSAYHWLDGVGPERIPSYDKAWYVEDPNTFGTREFIEWCRHIDAEPYICTNAGTGTPEEMSDWVEYCNGTMGKWARLRAEHGSEEPFKVSYWSIGNENYGDWEIGAKTIQEWSPFVTESAKMMLHSDPAIKLTAAATSDINWTLPLLQRAGKFLSLVSIHDYWDKLALVNEPASYLECMMASNGPEEQIQLTRSVIRAAGLGTEVGIAYDEWNLRGWHHPLGRGVDDAPVSDRDKNDINETYTMADALFSASFLNACLRNSDIVERTCMAPLINTRGPLFVYKDGIVKRTTYHVLWMYANLLEDNVVSTFSSSVSISYTGVSKIVIPESIAAVDSIATCDEKMEKWSIAVINRHPSEDLSCDLRIGGTLVQGPGEVTILSGDNPNAYNGIENPNRVIPKSSKIEQISNLKLPPHSLVIVSFAAENIRN